MSPFALHTLRSVIFACLDLGVAGKLLRLASVISQVSEAGHVTWDERHRLDYLSMRDQSPLGSDLGGRHTYDDE